jgi:hypothetical protein
MEQEHNWGPYTEKDDGSHRPGFVRVMKRGIEDGGDSPSDMSNPQEGALYLLQASGDNYMHLYVYYDGSWVKLTTGDHGELTGLSDHDHEQYVQTASFEPRGLDMGNNKINVPGATGTAARGFTLGKHYAEGHSLTDVTDAMKDNIVPVSMFNIQNEQVSVSGTLFSPDDVNDWYYTHIDLPEWAFFPNFYAHNNGATVRVSPPVKENVDGLALLSLNSFDAEVNYEYVS